MVHHPSEARNGRPTGIISIFHFPFFIRSPLTLNLSRLSFAEGEQMRNEKCEMENESFVTGKSPHPIGAPLRVQSLHGRVP